MTDDDRKMREGLAEMTRLCMTVAEDLQRRMLTTTSAKDLALLAKAFEGTVNEVCANIEFEARLDRQAERLRMAQAAVARREAAKALKALPRPSKLN